MKVGKSQIIDVIRRLPQRAKDLRTCLAKNKKVSLMNETPVMLASTILCQLLNCHMVSNVRILTDTFIYKAYLENHVHFP